MRGGSEYTHWYLTSDHGWIRGQREHAGRPKEGTLESPPNAVCVYRYERWGNGGLRNELRPLGILTREPPELELALKKFGPCPRRL